MKVSRSTPLSELLQEGPEVRELLAWYGVAVDTIEPETRLDELCRISNIDIDDLCVELEVLFFDRPQRRSR